MYKCQECGRKFRTVKAAERASNVGCPGCGGVDIDLDDEEFPTNVKPSVSKPEPGDRWLEGYAKVVARLGSDFLEHDHGMDY